MPPALTSEQVDQVVNNTVLTLLVRPDLLVEWHANLFELMVQARDNTLDDEAIFLAAVLSLLHAQNDDLPTGTIYDRAWDAILFGLQTGVVQPAATQSDTLSLDRVLNSVVETVAVVVNQIPEQKPVVVDELNQMRASAVEAEITELIAWLDDILAVLEGRSVTELGTAHQGIYAEFWAMLVRAIGGKR